MQHVGTCCHASRRCDGIFCVRFFRTLRLELVISRCPPRVPLHFPLPVPTRQGKRVLSFGDSPQCGVQSGTCTPLLVSHVTLSFSLRFMQVLHHVGREGCSMKQYGKLLMCSPFPRPTARVEGTKRLFVRSRCMHDDTCHRPRVLKPGDAACLHCLTWETRQSDPGEAR